MTNPKKGRFSAISRITEDLRKEKLGHMSTEITKSEEKGDLSASQQTSVEVLNAPPLPAETVKIEKPTVEEIPKEKEPKKEEKIDLGEKNESTKSDIESKSPIIVDVVQKEEKKIEKEERIPENTEGKRARKKNEESVELTDTIRITPFHNQVLQILYKRNKHRYKRREDLLEELLNRAFESDPIAKKVMLFIKEMEE